MGTFMNQIRFFTLIAILTSMTLNACESVAQAPEPPRVVVAPDKRADFAKELLPDSGATDVPSDKK